MTSGLPLQDRLQSNSPEHPDGWVSHSTIPLRIAKRDSPKSSKSPTASQLARRQSSAYKHLQKNNLVSKSPFRSLIPAPATPMRRHEPSPRRVSGEKRPRPVSMQAQAENEHPLGFKRRQSEVFQGLLQKEPVSKSPFKARPFKTRPADEDYSADEAPLPPPKSPRNRTPSKSPARSSLVTKRLHGPREAMGGRRTPQKTVTFHPNCDVMEFDAEAEIFDEDSIDDTDVISPDDPQVDSETSYDSIPVGEDSITGLVDSMLQDAEPHTPTHDRHLLPEGLDTEDGVPYGRTHHGDRLATAHHHSPANDRPDDLVLATHPELSTPTQSRQGTPLGSVSPGSHLPLGRSTHSERVRAQHQSKETLEEDVYMLPPSPSPAKPVAKSIQPHANRDSLIPKLSFDIPQEGRQDHDVGQDPFAIPPVKDDSYSVELSFTPAELAAQTLSPSADSKGINTLVYGIDEAEVVSSTSTPPRTPARSRTSLQSDDNDAHVFTLSNSNDSPFSPPPATPPTFSAQRDRSHSPANILPLRGSVSTHRVTVQSGSSRNSDAADSATANKSPHTCPEDIHRQPVHQNSVEGPSSTPELMLAASALQSDNIAVENADGNISDRSGCTEPVEEPSCLPEMTRAGNPTYDGVISLDPEPQDIDPPRPSLPVRAHTWTESDVPSLEQRGGKSVFEGLNLDFNSGFAMGDPGMSMSAGLGFGPGMGSKDIQLGDMRSALDRLMEDVAGSSNGALSADFGRLNVDSDPEVVAGGQSSTSSQEADANVIDGDATDDNNETEETMNSDTLMSRSTSHMTPLTSPVQDRVVSGSSIAPPLPPKDAIRTREELIIARKRAARRKEEEEKMALVAPRFTSGRPGNRRSLSTGDAEDLTAQASAALPFGSPVKGSGLLDVVPIENEEADPLTDSIDRELRRLEGPNKSKYHVREREHMIYASSDGDHVAHLGDAGDIHSGKAWRAVKRPSDMNEYSKQIKEMRAQETSGKGHGKVFVKVLGLRGVKLPFPRQPTSVSCTLNNGIHFVTTPECRLTQDCRIDQEFELIEHSKLEFTLTLKVRRDPHIVAQVKANAPPPPPPQVAPPPASKGGMRSFFRSGSPKKPSKALQRSSPTPPPSSPRIEENLARYLKPDGTLARAFITFRDIAKRCDTRLFETSYPLIGQKSMPGSSAQSLQIGEIVLQIFRLPPLPGILPGQLPQSLEECHRGLRHINWHKVTYFEGTLTQNGGDCTSWRRRRLRVIGANLVAFNDVTKKATATIDLKKAIAVEDDQDRTQLLSPASGATSRSRYGDEYDCPSGVERSFRLIFPKDQEITFFADSDEDKAKWLEVLRALVGRIPPNPLWAELVWQKQMQRAKHASNTMTIPMN